MIFKVSKSKKTTYVSLCIQIETLYKYKHNHNTLLKEFNDRIEEEYRLHDVDGPQTDIYNKIYFTGISLKNEIVNCSELISDKRKLEIEEDKKRKEEENKMLYHSCKWDNYDGYSNVTFPSTSYYSYSPSTIRTNSASTIRYEQTYDSNSRIRMPPLTPPAPPLTNTTAGERRGREDIVYHYDATTGSIREERLLDETLTQNLYLGVDGSIRFPR